MEIYHTINKRIAGRAEYMKYNKTIKLKNGLEVILRNGTIDDAEQVLDIFNKTHEETEFLLTYPEENPFTVEDEVKFLDEAEKSDKEVEILACIAKDERNDGSDEKEYIVIGSAGFNPVGKMMKLKHRADFGISVLKDYWGLGIGTELIKGCIECAKEAGFDLMELQTVAENNVAINLYKKMGFVEFGRNPYGFKKKDGSYQELVSMLCEL